jgi:hypothetical protein
MLVAQVLIGLKLKRQLGQTALLLGFSITVLVVVGLDDMTILISRYWLMVRNNHSAQQSVWILEYDRREELDQKVRAASSPFSMTT